MSNTFSLSKLQNLYVQLGQELKKLDTHHQNFIPTPPFLCGSTVPVQTQTQTQPKPVDTKASSGSSCSYMYKKGVKIGTKCKTKTRIGNVFCSRHSKKTKSTPKPRVNQKPKVTSASASRMSAGSPSLDQFQLKQEWDAKLGVFVDKKLNLVIDNNIAIGSVVDGKVCQLTDANVQQCAKYGIQYTMLSAPKSSNVAFVEAEMRDTDEDVDSYAD